MAEVPRSAYEMDAANEEAVDHDAIFGGRDGNSFMFDCAECRMPMIDDKRKKKKSVNLIQPNRATAPSLFTQSRFETEPNPRSPRRPTQPTNKQNLMTNHHSLN